MIDSTTFADKTRELLKCLYRISYGILWSHSDAEDAIQQALLKAWSSRNNANPDTFRAWLTRIVINESHNIGRYKNKVIPVEEVFPGHEDFILGADVNEAIYGLPEKYRVPFIMKYIANYREHEIAAILHLPQSTIKGRLSKARAKLRAELSDSEVTLT